MCGRGGGSLPSRCRGPPHAHQAPYVIKISVTSSDRRFGSTFGDRQKKGNNSGQGVGLVIGVGRAVICATLDVVSELWSLAPMFGSTMVFGMCEAVFCFYSFLLRFFTFFFLRFYSFQSFFLQFLTVLLRGCGNDW